MIRYSTGIRVTKVFGALLVGAVLLVGCGDDGSNDAPSAAPTSDPDLTVPDDVADLSGSDAVGIDVVDNEYRPNAFRVDPGAEISFTNKGEDQHNVTPAEDGAFATIDEEDLRPGDTATLVLDDPGTYFIYCSLHGTPTRGQRGVIIVGSD